MKTLLLILVITLGAFFPYGHPYAPLIKYILMILLFFAFLEIKIDREIIKRSHFIILSLNVAIPISLFFVINLFNNSVAEAAFITALAPTAIAAPVIISLLGGRVEYVTFSLILTNSVIAFLIPFLLPFLLNKSADISVIDILLPILYVFLIPLIIAKITKIFLPKIHSFFIKIKDSAFYFLLIGIYLGTSRASNYISTEMTSSLTILFVIAAFSMLICFTDFSLGKLIGGKEDYLETGQSLGQKNNAFTIWIALTFISPIAVLGPVFYILFQNIYISWQLHNKSKVS